MKQPNFLLIMADQMAAPALPFYGHPVVQTPYLSHLAENGVVFSNAYCNSPLCAPSRFSMLTGQLTSRIGAYDNAAYFAADVPTFAHYLRTLGYHTCLSGKMHLVGADQLHGFEERLTTDIYPSDFGWTPDWENFEKRPSWYHNMLSVVQAGTCKASNQIDFDEEVTHQSVRKIYDLARDKDQSPFLLLVSFTQPHDPFTITPEYWNRYDQNEIDLPAVPQIPYERLDPHSKRLHHVCALGQYAQTEKRIRNARHAYYGMISYIDDKVGQLLQALKGAGLSEDTIVIFLSDHGEMLGERGLWYKMTFFEWSARVPMIFHFPARFSPHRVAQTVSLVDVLPTLVEIANDGCAGGYADSLDGQSLLPSLEGNEIKGAGTVYGETLCEGAIAPVVMIGRDRYKYVYSDPDPSQLYDLEADPNELHNLADQPQHKETRRMFDDEVRAKWDLKKLHQQVLASQRRRKLVYRALRQGKHAPWDFQPFQDAARQYMRNHLDLNKLERTARYPSPEIPDPDGTDV
ncbi:MAG: choline-sulfatase [Deltaproteobacteria bacterium]|nr:choline-sulfatase [Deltaproteobacteria bacterium]